MNKIKFRVNNSLTKKQIGDNKTRLSAFVKAAGGAVAISSGANVPLGTLKSALGGSERCISPVLANKLCQYFKGDVPAKFTREYLRPDVTTAQWERLDDLIMKGA